MKKNIAALVALASLNTQAQLIVSFTGGDNLSVGPGTAAFENTPAISETIQALGVYDSDPTTPGLFSSHQVGVWDATTKVLLASTTVPAQGAANIGDFWYVNIPAITIPAGHTFVLGVSYADNDFDFAKGNITSITMAPGNTIGNARLSTGVGFEFPDLSVPGANFGFVGGNALFAPVPEPSDISLIAGASLVILATLRRCKLI